MAWQKLMAGGGEGGADTPYWYNQETGDTSYSNPAPTVYDNGDGTFTDGNGGSFRNVNGQFFQDTNSGESGGATAVNATVGQMPFAKPSPDATVTVNPQTGQPQWSGLQNGYVGYYGQDGKFNPTTRSSNPDSSFGPFGLGGMFIPAAMAAITGGASGAFGVPEASSFGPDLWAEEVGGPLGAESASTGASAGAATTAASGGGESSFLDTINAAPNASVIPGTVDSGASALSGASQLAPGALETTNSLGLDAAGRAASSFANTAANSFLNNAPVESRNVPRGKFALPDAGNAAAGLTGSGAVGDFVGSPLGRTLGSTALQLGMGAASASQQKSAASNFNNQLSSLISRANDRSFSASQATPVGAVNLSPKQSATLGGGGTPQDPSATLAGAGRPAPASPGAGIGGGTTPAPSMNFNDVQTGAVKLGQRPVMYA